MGAPPGLWPLHGGDGWGGRSSRPHGRRREGENPCDAGASGSRKTAGDTEATPPTVCGPRERAVPSPAAQGSLPLFRSIFVTKLGGRPRGNTRGRVSGPWEGSNLPAWPPGRPAARPVRVGAGSAPGGNGDPVLPSRDQSAGWEGDGGLSCRQGALCGRRGPCSARGGSPARTRALWRSVGGGFSSRAVLGTRGAVERAPEAAGWWLRGAGRFYRAPPTKGRLRGTVSPRQTGGGRELQQSSSNCGVAEMREPLCCSLGHGRGGQGEGDKPWGALQTR